MATSNPQSSPELFEKSLTTDPDRNPNPPPGDEEEKENRKLENSSENILSSKKDEDSSPGLPDSGSSLEPSSLSSKLSPLSSQTSQSMGPLLLEDETQPNITECPFGTNSQREMVITGISQRDDEEGFFDSSCPEVESKEFILPGLGSTSLHGKKRSGGKEEEEHHAKKFKSSASLHDHEKKTADDVIDVLDDSIIEVTNDPAIPKKSDDSTCDKSVVVISDADESPLTQRPLPLVKMPMPRLSAETCTNSPSLNASNPDDSRNKSSDATPVLELFNTPDISASPIMEPPSTFGISTLKKRMGKHSSTPGGAGVRGRVQALRPREYKNFEESQEVVESSQEVTDESEEIKKNEKSLSYFCIFGGQDGLTKEIIDKLCCDENSVIPFKVVSVDRSKAAITHQKLLSALDELKSLSNESSTLKRARVSDVSGTSTSTSGTGYLADGSSGISSSSGAGAALRDRLSTMPELEIPKSKNRVPVPLPTEEKKKWVSRRRSSKEEEASLTNKTCSRSNADVREADNVIKEGIMGLVKYNHSSTIYTYEPAKVVKQLEDENKWQVVFLDNVERTVMTEDVIPLKCLVPGQEVSACVSDNKKLSNEGLIVAHPDSSQDNELFFQIQFREMPEVPQIEEARVRGSMLFLTPGQASAIKAQLGGKWNTPSLNMGDVDCRNVVHYKRVSKKISSVSSPTSSSARRKFLKKGGHNVETSAAETEPEGMKSPIKKNSRQIAPCVTTTSDDENYKKPVRSSRKRKKIVKQPTVPLFNNLSFLLTVGTRKSRPGNMDFSTEDDTSDSDEDRSEPDNCDNMSKSPEISKRVVRNMIVANGGKILETFPGKTQRFPDKLIILSNQMCETMTYLSSIAYSFPRLSFQWVKDSLDKNELLPHKAYSLPVGYSELKNREMELSDLPNDMTRIFEGLHILLASESNTSFNDDWKLLLTRLGAGSVYSRTSGKIDRKLNNVNLVIADSKAPDSILQDAKKKGIKVVNTKWLIQSLINGKKLDYTNFLTPRLGPSRI